MCAPMHDTLPTANTTLVLNGTHKSNSFQRRIDAVKQRNVIMTETVVSFPRSKERLDKLVRNILDDIVAIDMTLDDIFAECSPEQFDEMTRRLEFIQAEVEAIREFSPRQVVGWITG